MGKRVYSTDKIGEKGRTENSMIVLEYPFSSTVELHMNMYIIMCSTKTIHYNKVLLGECNALLAHYTQCIRQPSLALCKIMHVNR